MTTVVEQWAAIGQHRYTILAGWLSPVGILALPESFQMPYLVGLMVLCLSFIFADTAGGVEP